jgi:NAD(P)H dehydrogenase (quinone)
VSANIAVIYSGAELRDVAAAFGAEAERRSAGVRVRRFPGDGASGGAQEHEEATLSDVRWADGIAFGTPVASGRPSPALMAFITQCERQWGDSELFDKVVSLFTDEPEHYEAEAVLEAIYIELYQWGAVIVGPRATELEFDARPQRGDPEGAGRLTGPRLRTTQYRARRLTALAGVLSAERSRRARLEL